MKYNVSYWSYVRLKLKQLLNYVFNWTTQLGSHASPERPALQTVRGGSRSLRSQARNLAHLMPPYMDGLNFSKPPLISKEGVVDLEPHNFCPEEDIPPNLSIYVLPIAAR